MARKPRLEIEGGLYHLITRGAGRRDIGASATDLARLTGLDIACISRRHAAALRRVKHDKDLERLINKVAKLSR